MNRRKLAVVSLSLFLIALAVAIALAGGDGLSQPARLNAAPPAESAAAEVVRFVALGDTGTGESAQFAVARRMLSYHDEKRYETVLLLGDNIYPNGNPSDLAAKFEKPYAELLRRGVRFRAVLGNHDVQRGREAQIRYQHFNMGGRAYYSFVEGNGLVEFFALDSNRMDQEQLNWLEGALSASKARWKIAFFHHPIYSSSRAHGSSLKLRALLEPLLVRYRVAAAFSGHDHVYERIKPQQGVKYFVSGAGGKLRRDNINRNSPLFEAGNDQFNSFMYVEVKPERLTFWAVEPEGRILDVGYLTPPQPAAPKK